MLSECLQIRPVMKWTLWSNATGITWTAENTANKVEKFNHAS